MGKSLNAEKVREYAKALDDAIEKHDIEEIVSYFSKECKIQLPGVNLNGHEGLRKAIRWMYRYLGDIVLIPVTIMVQNDIFFEEFIVKAKAGGHDIEVAQTEVLLYEDDYKVKAIRLYFDRLELAHAFSSNLIDRILISQVNRASLRGL
jgi:hypothetical protein